MHGGKYVYIVGAKDEGSWTKLVRRGNVEEDEGETAGFATSHKVPALFF